MWDGSAVPGEMTAVLGDFTDGRDGNRQQVGSAARVVRRGERGRGSPHPRLHCCGSAALHTRSTSAMGQRYRSGVDLCTRDVGAVDRLCRDSGNLCTHDVDAAVHTASTAAYSGVAEAYSGILRRLLTNMLALLIFLGCSFNFLNSIILRS